MKSPLVRFVAAANLALGAVSVSSGCRTSGNSTVDAASQGALVSPLVGTWRGKSDVNGDVAKLANELLGGPLTGPSTLTLNADGTGFLKVGKQGERPISWQQQGERVVMQVRNVPGSGVHDQNGGGPWVGTLGTGHSSMVIDMDQVKVSLSKSSS